MQQLTLETRVSQLWTTKTSREFIEKKYPKFLKTYDGFRYPVQRVDALRYYLMRYYGGIYIDLDNVSLLAPPPPPQQPVAHNSQLTPRAL